MNLMCFSKILGAVPVSFCTTLGLQGQIKLRRFWYWKQMALLPSRNLKCSNSTICQLSSYVLCMPNSDSCITVSWCCYFLLGLCINLCLKRLPSIISYSSFKNCSNIIFCVISNLIIPNLPLSWLDHHPLCPNGILYFNYFFVILCYNNLFTWLSFYLTVSFWRQGTCLFISVFLMPSPIPGIF